MFNKLFNRSKATSATPAPTPAPAPPIPPAPAPSAPAALAPTPQAPAAVAPKANRLDAFKEEWQDKWETSHEVIEGNGGLTDWGTWTDAVQKEEQSFAPTEPMPLTPKQTDRKEDQR